MVLSLNGAASAPHGSLRGGANPLSSEEADCGD